MYLHSPSRSTKVARNNTRLFLGTKKKKFFSESEEGGKDDNWTLLEHSSIANKEKVKKRKDKKWLNKEGEEIGKDLEV